MLLNIKVLLVLEWERQENMFVTDRHDMTLAVKVALNPNTINQLSTNAIYLDKAKILSSCKRLTI